MGYGDAEHFLKLLSDIPGSPEVPTGWAGEIKGITYRIGGTLQNSKYVMNTLKTFHIALPFCFRFSVGFRFRLIGLKNLFPKASQKFYGQCTNFLRYVVFELVSLVKNNFQMLPVYKAFTKVFRKLQITAFCQGKRDIKCYKNLYFLYLERFFILKDQLQNCLHCDMMENNFSDEIIAQLISEFLNRMSPGFEILALGQ